MYSPRTLHYIILDYTVSDEDLFSADSDLETPLNPLRPALGTYRQQICSAVTRTPVFSAILVENPSRSSNPISCSTSKRFPVCRSSQIIARPQVSDIKSWIIPKLQQQLQNKNIPFSSSAHKDQLFQLYITSLQTSSSHCRNDATPGAQLPCLCSLFTLCPKPRWAHARLFTDLSRSPQSCLHTNF
ncbi:hypothetical protein EOD39_11548 [Acipenser ruthenus]|uniref:Uncharacterized protein n=1 Tax=Acipenser ruthenus TaxID=7906 RepID=A0A444UNC9_ACIRT|nr:hypothetical protein EOD39_11548 [Acipenser ruthenus]